MEKKVTISREELLEIKYLSERGQRLALEADQHLKSVKEAEKELNQCVQDTAKRNDVPITDDIQVSFDVDIGTFRWEEPEAPEEEIDVEVVSE